MEGFKFNCKVAKTGSEFKALEENASKKKKNRNNRARTVCADKVYYSLVSDGERGEIDKRQNNVTYGDCSANQSASSRFILVKG